MALAEAQGRLAVRLLNSAMLVGVGTLAWRGMVFVLFASISSRLPVATSSALVQTITMVTSYGTIVHFASSTFLVRLLTRDLVDHADFRLALLFSSAIAVLGAGIVTALCLSNPQVIQTLFGGSTWLAIIVIYLMSIGVAAADFATAVLYGTGRYRAAVGAQFTMSACYAVAILLLWTAPDLGLFAALAATATTGLIAVGWSLAGVRLTGEVSFRHGREVLFGFLNMSAPLVISAFTVNPLTLTVVGSITSFSNHQLLAFLIGLNWMGLVMVIPGQLSSASINFFMRATEETRRYLSVAVYLINLVSVLAACAIIIPLADLFASVYGEARLEVAEAIRICILSALPIALTQIVSNQFAARANMWGIMAANGAFGLVFGSCLLIQWYMHFDVSSLGWMLLAAHTTRFLLARALLQLRARTSA